MPRTATQKAFVSALLVTLMIAALALACAADTCTLMSGALGGACNSTTIGSALTSGNAGVVANLLVLAVAVASAAALLATRSRSVVIAPALAVVPTQGDPLHGRLRL